MIPFPCEKCGCCCRNIKNYEPASYLNRGDGVCKYLNEKNNLCTIYENRPDFCNSRTYYEKNYKEKISWDEYIKLMKPGCKYLQNKK